MQDDFKVNSRFTVNAGLRYEIFHQPDRRRRTGWATSTSSTYTLVYAGENGATRSANKKTRYNNFAPRLGVTYGLTDDMRTVLRTGFGITYFPSPYAAGNLNHLNVPFTISQNVQHQTNPLDMSLVRTIDNPFPAIVPVKPQTTAELNAANPRVIGHGYSSETAYAEQWHLGIERQLFSTLLVEAEYVGSAGKHLTLCYNPNEIQPGPGSNQSRRLLQPVSNLSNMLQCDPRNRSTFHAGTLKVQQRFSNGLQFLVSYTYGKSLDYGGAAASGGGAVGNGQTVTNMDAWHGPSGYDVRHRGVVSYVYELPFGTGPALDVRQRRDSRRHRRRLAAVGHHDDDDGTAVHGLPADRRQQRRAELAQPYRSGHARQSVSGHVVQSGRLRGATGQHLRRLGPRDPVRARTRQLRHVAVEAVHDRGTYRTSSSGGTRSTCSTTRHSGSRTRTSATPASGVSPRRLPTTGACSLR